MSEKFPVNHDFHIHSYISLCERDPGMTADFILSSAKELNYAAVCVADHLWDESVPVSDMYATYVGQGIDSLKRILPLPKDNDVRFLFGCEAEYCGGDKLGVAPNHYDIFDMIVIPTNHFHAVPMVAPEGCDTAEKVADLFTERLEQLAELDLPWKKVGIAHLNGMLALVGVKTLSARSRYEVFNEMTEKRLRPVFNKLGRLGAGIELNGVSYDETIPGNQLWKDNQKSVLKLMRIAKEENCKFYCGSDAHTTDAFLKGVGHIREVADVLGLTADDLFIPA